MEFCPVCMLRKALVEIESDESSSDDCTPTSQDVAPRFEHYELVRGEDGKPVELGRGGDGGHIQGNSIRNMPKIASGAALSPP
jgi:hypothetical protein